MLWARTRAATAAFIGRTRDRPLWRRAGRFTRVAAYAALALTLAFGLGAVLETARIYRQASYLLSLQPVTPKGQSPGLGTLIAAQPAVPAGTPTEGEQPRAQVPGSASGQPRSQVPAPVTPAPAPASAQPPAPSAPVLGSIDNLGWPTVGTVISKYDWQLSKTHQDWMFHTGIDIRTAANAVVVAAATGKVESVTQTAQWDWRIVLSHAGGARTEYANLAGASVKAGDVVTKGQPIGRAGDRGAFEIADGPHLHFEVYVDGERVDPQNHLR
jgi:murein DD-endopeptidase MepM/ murein hydrolase activator NlpD